jgi:hypothetical protein
MFVVEGDDHLDKRLMLLFLEGVSLMSTFHIVLHFSQTGMFPSLVQGNLSIQNDESLHRDYHLQKVRSLLGRDGLLKRRGRVMEISHNVVEMEIDLIASIYEGIPLSDHGEVIGSGERLRAEGSPHSITNIPSCEEVMSYVIHLNAFILRDLEVPNEEVLSLTSALESKWSIKHHVEPAWMKVLSLQKRNNFFEVKQSTYSGTDVVSLDFITEGEW